MRRRNVAERCENCERPISKWGSRCCSLKCFGQIQRKQVLVRFLNGALPPQRKIAEVVREHLLEKSGGVCWRCGWAERNPVTQRVALEVEHVDGDWRNNSPLNLRILCPNCHALTRTFRGLNRGRGREARAVDCDGVRKAKPTVRLELTTNRFTKSVLYQLSYVGVQQSFAFTGEEPLAP